MDSFLDGVNVERLAALIARQAEAAQFMVVSHRRPMIGAAQRTIGVTQARGAHTQVVGLPDAACTIGVFAVQSERDRRNPCATMV